MKLNKLILKKCTIKVNYYEQTIQVQFKIQCSVITAQCKMAGRRICEKMRTFLND